MKPSYDELVKALKDYQELLKSDHEEQLEMGDCPDPNCHYCFVQSLLEVVK
jgi:hypothetical protein